MWLTCRVYAGGGGRTCLRARDHAAGPQALLPQHPGGRQGRTQQARTGEASMQLPSGHLCPCMTGQATWEELGGHKCDTCRVRCSSYALAFRFQRHWAEGPGSLCEVVRTPRPCLACLTARPVASPPFHLERQAVSAAPNTTNITNRLFMTFSHPCPRPSARPSTQCATLHTSLCATLHLTLRPSARPSTRCARAVPPTSSRGPCCCCTRRWRGRRGRGRRGGRRWRATPAWYSWWVWAS